MADRKIAQVCRLFARLSHEGFMDGMMVGRQCVARSLRHWERRRRIENVLAPILARGMLR